MKELKDGFTDLQMLPYLVVTHVPCKIHPEHGEIISAEILRKCEEVTIETIVIERLPIHGRELKLMRKFAGFSLQEIADRIGVKTHQTVLNWERETDARLNLADEMAIRLLVADRLGIKFVGGYSAMVGVEETPALRIGLPRAA